MAILKNTLNELLTLIPPRRTKLQTFCDEVTNAKAPILIKLGALFHDAAMKKVEF